MAKLDAFELYKQGLNDPFWIARAHAIQAYANLEQSLCRILGDLLHITPIKAAIVFFKIVNSKARDNILKELVEAEHGKKYEVFFESLFAMLTFLSDKRNQIVHWNTAVCWKGDNEFSGYVLMKPGFGAMKPGMNPITRKDMVSFSTKCSFLARLLMMFHLCCRGSASANTKTWSEIFQQPIVYPPPINHPLHQTIQEPEDLLSSFVQLTSSDPSLEAPTHEKKTSKHQQKRAAKQSRKDKWKKAGPS